MDEILAKELNDGLIAFKAPKDQEARLRRLKATTSMDVNGTIRLWFKELLEHLESKASEFPIASDRVG